MPIIVRQKASFCSLSQRYFANKNKLLSSSTFFREKRLEYTVFTGGKNHGNPQDSGT